jgi:putative oxidoreductase
MIRKLVLLFLGSAVDSITNSAKTDAIIGARGLPIPQLLVWATILLEVVLSLALLFGFRSRVAALGLVAFTIVATTLFHLHPDSEPEMHKFYKDIAIFGALLVIAMRQPCALQFDVLTCRVPMITETTSMITMKDGVRVAVDIFRPEGAGPLPDADHPSHLSLPVVAATP